MSDIITKIAFMAIKDKNNPREETIAFCVALASSAWNNIKKSDSNHNQIEMIISQLNSSGVNFWSELCSENWRELQNKMVSYIEKNHQNDNRIVTSFGLTPHGTVRIEWA